MTFFASFIAAFIDTISILMIVFGAVLLFHTMEQKGFIEEIQESLHGIHPNRNFQFYFLAFFLTAFFESVAGFGTPGAIVPLLLISMGFPPITSIASVLLIDSIFAVSGAIGTPVTAGLERPLSLSTDMTSEIYFYASIAIALAGIVIHLVINRFMNREIERKKNNSFLLYSSIMIPYVCLSFYLKELTGIISAIIMVLVSFIFFFKKHSIKWRPWLPYILLVVILLLPKIFSSLASFLLYEISFESIFGTKVSASIRPLRSPLTPFIIASIFAAIMVKDLSFDLKPVISKTLAVFQILFPSLAITQLMLSSGTEMPSMVETLAVIFVGTGEAYPLLSPLIGVLGTFITGSTTVSNIIFGPMQYSAAQNLNTYTEIILALQLTGASLGNAICLFNIIAASAVAGVKNYSAILKKNMLPVLLAAIVAAIFGYVLLALQ